MKKRLLTLLPITFLSANLYALDINSAIELSLENNNSYKKQNYIYDEAKLDVKMSKASFRPNLSASYNYQANKYDAGSGKDHANAGLLLSYNLFNGLKDKYNLASSKDLLQNSKFTLDAKRQDIILSTKQAYIAYLKSIKNIETRKNAFKLLEQQYKDSQNRFDQGLLARNDLLQVNAQMLQEKQNLARAIADSKIAKFRLNNVLGGVLEKDEKIEDLSKDEILVAKYDEKDLDSRSEVKALENLIKSIKHRKKANKGDNLPTADLNLSYTKFGEDAQLNMVDSAMDEQQSAVIALKWDIYTGGKNTIEDAKLLKQIMQANEDLAELKLSIKLQQEEALEELLVSELNYETAKISLEQSRENYKIVNNRFKEGLSTSTDLINANFLLSSAKQSFDNAFYDRFLAKASLDRIFEVQ